MNDIDFIRFGLLRGIGPVDSGRHFLQTAEEVHGEPLPLSAYVKSLKSQRRTNMLEMFEKQSYVLHGKTLEWLEIYYIRQFQELDQYTVKAADGHFIDHACHTEKGADGKVYAAGFIYSMNIRNGLLKGKRPKIDVLAHITFRRIFFKSVFNIPGEQCFPLFNRIGLCYTR